MQNGHIPSGECSACQATCSLACAAVVFSSHSVPRFAAPHRSYPVACFCLSIAGTLHLQPRAADSAVGLLTPPMRDMDTLPCSDMATCGIVRAFLPEAGSPSGETPLSTRCLLAWDHLCYPCRRVVRSLAKVSVRQYPCAYPLPLSCTLGRI
jgi:hypothetical protein